MVNLSGVPTVIVCTSPSEALRGGYRRVQDHDAYPAFSGSTGKYVWHDRVEGLWSARER